jgi:hypothetical protein
MLDETSLLTLKGRSSYIQINGKTIDLSQNSTSDILKVAFSIVSIENNLDSVPSFANIILEFSNSENTQIARLEINADNNELDFVENRYVVAEKRLEELTYEGASFSWRDISVIKVYASANSRFSVTNKKVETVQNIKTATLTTASTHNIKVGDRVSIFGVDDELHDGLNGYQIVTSQTATTFSFSTTADEITLTDVDNGFVDSINKDFYICLDAIRLDNVTTTNPLYGLSGYSVVQNSEQLAIVKSPNTNNYLEYRFMLDVS